MISIQMKVIRPFTGIIVRLKYQLRLFIVSTHHDFTCPIDWLGVFAVCCVDSTFSVLSSLKNVRDFLSFLFICVNKVVCWTVFAENVVITRKELRSRRKQSFQKVHSPKACARYRNDLRTKDPNESHITSKMQKKISYQVLDKYENSSRMLPEMLPELKDAVHTNGMPCRSIINILTLDVFIVAHSLIMRKECKREAAIR